MWFRFVLPGLLVLLPWPALAQMLGNLNDYPKLFIAMHYQAPDGAGNEGIQIDWRDQLTGTPKVVATVQPQRGVAKAPATPPAPGEKPASSWVESELPATVITPIFNEVRNVTALFRIPPSNNIKTLPDNELFSLTVSHPNLDVNIHLIFRRNDPAAWNAAAALWSHLRATMPSPGKELIHDHR